MAVVIPRHSLLFSRSKVFTTTRDQQTCVTIQVFQGLRTLTKHCLYLGEFNLTGIPPAPRGTPRIEVTFGFDCAYALVVLAQDEAHGIWEKMTIPLDNYTVWHEDVEQMVREAEEEKERMVGPHSLKAYVYKHINEKDVVEKKKKEMEEKEKEKKKKLENYHPFEFEIEYMFKMLALQQGRARFKNKTSTSGNQIAEM